MRRSFSLFLCGAVLLCTILSTQAAEQVIVRSDADISSAGSLPSTCSESKLGCLAADAAVYAMGADLAIIPGGLVDGTLEHGAVFPSDLSRVIPEDADLTLYSVTLPQLKSLLEYGLSHLTTDDTDRIIIQASSFEDFPQVSGFTWTYDVSAPVGARVLYLSIDGTEVDLSDTSMSFTLAAPSAMLERAGLSLHQISTGPFTLRSSMLTYLGSLDLLSPPSSRTTAIGTANYPLIDKLPITAIAAACVLIAVLAAIPRIKQKKYFSFEK